MHHGNKVVVKDLTIFDAINASVMNMERTLSHMKAPINQAEHSQAGLEKDLSTYLQNLYDNVKKAIKAGNLIADPVGILTNEFILATAPSAKKAYPHHVLIPVLLSQIINQDKEPLDMAARNRNKKAQAPVAQVTPLEAIATNLEPIASTKEGLSELDACPAEVIIPEKTQEIIVETIKEEIKAPPAVTIEPTAEIQLSQVAQSVGHTPVAAAEIIQVPVDVNIAFHIPYMTKVEGILTEMNNALDAEEVKPLRIQLTSTVREWTEAFYKSLHDLDNPNRVTVDKVGLLTSTTKYSQPDMHAKYDYANLVDKIIAKVSEKYKNTDGKETTVHSMATALSGAQDTTSSTFTIPTVTSPDGEVLQSVTVNKVTNDLTSHVKDVKGNIIVTACKGAYKGIQNFFKSMWKQMKRFGAWIKSWFTGKDEVKVIVTPEQALIMEAAAKARAEALQAQAVPA